MAFMIKLILLLDAGDYTCWSGDQQSKSAKLTVYAQPGVPHIRSEILMIMLNLCSYKYETTNYEMKVIHRLGLECTSNFWKDRFQVDEKHGC